VKVFWKSQLNAATRSLQSALTAAPSAAAAKAEGATVNQKKAEVEAKKHSNREHDKLHHVHEHLIFMQLCR
jgi:hypothetical protein